MLPLPDCVLNVLAQLGSRFYTIQYILWGCGILLLLRALKRRKYGRER
jgi:hypothetical protein